MRWDDLSPRQLQERANRVMIFSRQMPGDVSDTFHDAERLDSLLGGAAPEAVERAIDEAKQSIAAGGTNQDRAVERLMAQFAKSANGEDGRLLATAFRRCLNDQRPFAKVFAKAKQEDGEIPDEREREVMSYCRQQHALQFQREHGIQLDPAEFVPDGELNSAVLLAERRRISFARALELVRTGH